MSSLSVFACGCALLANLVAGPHRTPLHLAMQLGVLGENEFFETTCFLLEAGADPTQDVQNLNSVSAQSAVTCSLFTVCILAIRSAQSSPSFSLAAPDTDTGGVGARNFVSNTHQEQPF